jgi:poly(ADP-ribose) glycohydrolase ARH3
LKARVVAVDLRSRFRGVLLGGFVGDALGYPFEGTPVGALARLAGALQRRVEAPRGWRYSDDTEMAIGVAESQVTCGSVDARHMLATLVQHYDPARGYGKGMKLIARALADGDAWESVAATAWPDGSRGNGAAVRVGSIACLYHDDDARLQVAVTAGSATTHAHPEAIAWACVLARAIAFLLRLPDPAALQPEALLRAIAGGADVERKLAGIAGLLATSPPRAEVVAVLGHGVLAADSVPLAIYALLSAPREFTAVVTHAIGFGGDTDSIGAMAGALAGGLLGDAAIPDPWLAALENGARGRDHAVRLADQLHGLWQR